MLSDYIPVYYPALNAWSIPNYELENYQDYVAKPQKLSLSYGHVVKGIPLFHLGTWGAFGVDITETIRKIAKNPNRVAKMYRSKKVAADVAAFFKLLRKRYPRIVSAKPFNRRRSTAAGKLLNVPARYIVSVAEEEGAK